MLTTRKPPYSNLARNFPESSGSSATGKLHRLNLAYASSVANMNSLKVPDSGLLLAGSGSDSSLPPQAFHIQLDKSTIESIIQSSRNGEDLRLLLGQSPVSLGQSPSFLVCL